MHTPHTEKHFEATDTVRDVVIGMSDGLTVPFALAAGLTGMAVATSKLVVIAGIAEIAAGSIAMGLGGYLAARTDRDHYESERQREIRETVELPEKEADEVADIFRGYGMSEQDIAPVVSAIRGDQKGGVPQGKRLLEDARKQGLRGKTKDEFILKAMGENITRRTWLKRLLKK